MQRVRRALRTRAVGHTGTLDPFATGLLVVLVGRATRLARFVEAEAKTYLATARLGVATDTDDLTGAVLEAAGRSTGEPASEVRRGAGRVRRASSASGRPRYSAKHVDGERSYRLARRGDRGGAAGDDGDGARGSSWCAWRRPSWSSASR